MMPAIKIHTNIVMCDGERTCHVDDIVKVLIDSESLVNPIAVVENEDDEHKTGFINWSGVEAVKHYHPRRVVYYNSFREEVRAIRSGDNALLKWLRGLPEEPPRTSLFVQ